MSIIVLTPSVLSVLVHRYSGRLFETKKWLTALLAFAVAGLGIGYLSPPIDGFDFSKYLLPILPGSNSSLSVVSIEHTASILNWLYFSALAFLFLAPRMIKKLVLRYTRNDALTAYSVSILAPALVFVLFFAPQLGSPRDWDLFSVVSFLMLVSGLLLTSDDDGPGAWTWTPPVIVLSLALSISFVTINSSINKSTSRFVEIIEIGRTGNLFKEYNLMSAYAADFPEIAERRFEFTEKAWREIPYTKRDSVLILNKLGEQLLSRGSPDSALSLINLSLTVDTSHLLTYHHLIKALRVGGKAERLYGLAETMSTRFQDDARGIMDAGILYAELGDTANSNKCIVLAYTLDSNDVFIMVNYGVNMLRSGKPNKAVGILEKSVQRFPDYFLANLNLSLAYATVRNVELAQYYLRAAEKLIANESEALQVSRLRTVIDRR